MAEALHVTGGGGLGDLIYHYFCKRKWQLVAPIKKAHPEIRIVGVLTCHASPAPELIELNPHIDVVVTHPWYPPKHAREQMWREVLKTEDINTFAGKHKIKPDGQKLYLSKHEQGVYQNLAGKPYILMHPFAGLPHRGCLPHPKDGEYRCFPDYKYIELARRLNDQGFNVVIVGYSEKARGGAARIHENFLDVDEPPGIVNLIDKASLRLSVQLARGARGFIGSHSSMLAAAWTNHVPSVFFYPNVDDHGNKRTIKTHGGETGTWQLEKPYHYGFELSPKQFLDLEVDEVVDQLHTNMEAKHGQKKHSV
jgi:hypothetical protein